MEGRLVIVLLASSYMLPPDLLFYALFDNALKNTNRGINVYVKVELYPKRKMQKSRFCKIWTYYSFAFHRRFSFGEIRVVAKLILTSCCYDFSMGKCRQNSVRFDFIFAQSRDFNIFRSGKMKILNI